MKRKQKSSLLKRVAKWVAILAIVAVSAYAFLTGSFFLRTFVLPRVGTALGTDLNAKAIDLSLWKQTLVAKGVVFGELGKPLARAEELRVGFDLKRILAADIALNGEIRRLEVSLKRNAEGHWNLPFAETSKPATETETPKRSEEPKASSPVRLDIKNFVLRDAEVSLELAKSAGNGDDARFTAKNLGLRLENLRNGETATLKLEGDIDGRAGDTVSIERCRVGLTAAITLDTDLAPTDAKLDLLIDALRGKAGTTSLNDRVLALTVRADKSDTGVSLRELVVKETLGDTVETALRLTGDITTSPFAATARFEEFRVTSDILNLASGLLGGYQVGDAELRYEGQWAFSANTARGKGGLSLTNATVSRPAAGITTLPTIDVDVTHDLDLDLSAKVADLRALNAKVKTKEGPASAEARLSRPIRLNWNNLEKRAIGGAEMKVEFRDLPLNALNLFVPKTACRIDRGELNASYDVSLQGDAIVVKGQSVVSDAALTAGDFSIKDLKVTHHIDISSENGEEFFVNPASLQISVGDQDLVKLTSTGNFIPSSQTGAASVFLLYLKKDAVSLVPEKFRNAMAVRQALAILGDAFVRARVDGHFNLAARSATATLARADLVRGQSEPLSAALVRPAKFNWDHKRFRLEDSDLKGELKFNAIDLIEWSPLLPKTDRFELLAGTTSGVATATFPMNFARCDFSLETKLDDFAYAYAGERVESLSLLSKLSGAFVPNDNARIQTLNAQFFSGKKLAAALDAEGRYGLKDGAIAVRARSFSLTEKLALLAPKAIGAPKFRRLNATGSVNFEKNGDRFAASTKVLIARLVLPGDAANSPEFSGELDIDARKDANGFHCPKAACKIAAKNRSLMDFSASAEIPLPMNADTAAIEVKSRAIDLKAIEAAFAKSATEKSAADQTPSSPPSPGETTAEKEPGPIDFKGARWQISLDLRGVSYGNALSSDIIAKAALADNRLNVSSLDVTVNGIPLHSAGSIDFAAADGWPYSGKTEATNLELGPVLKAIGNDGSGADAKAKLENFTLTVSGKGVTTPNLKKNLIGDLNVTFGEVAIAKPLIQKNQILWLLFCPITILDELSNYIPSDNVLPEKILSPILKGRDIVKKLRDIKFKKGEVAVHCEKGAAKLAKCHFEGDVIKTFDTGGFVDFDKRYGVDAIVNISLLQLPVSVNGQLGGKTNFDFQKTLTDFLKMNASNILNPSNIKDILTGTGDGASGLGEKAKQILSDLLKTSDDGATKSSTSTSSGNKWTDIISTALEGAPDQSATKTTGAATGTTAAPAKTDTATSILNVIDNALGGETTATSPQTATSPAPDTTTATPAKTKKKSSGGLFDLIDQALKPEDTTTISPARKTKTKPSNQRGKRAPTLDDWLR